MPRREDVGDGEDGVKGHGRFMDAFLLFVGKVYRFVTLTVLSHSLPLLR